MAVVNPSALRSIALGEQLAMDVFNKYTDGLFECVGINLKECAEKPRLYDIFTLKNNYVMAYLTYNDIIFRSYSQGDKNIKCYFESRDIPIDMSESEILDAYIEEMPYISHRWLV